MSYITLELDLVGGDKITIVPKYIESLESIGMDQVVITMISGKTHVITNSLDFLTSIIPRE